MIEKKRITRIRQKLVKILSLHFLLNGLVLLCLFEQASSLDRNIGVRKKKFSETILAAMIDEWTVC